LRCLQDGWARFGNVLDYILPNPNAFDAGNTTAGSVGARTAALPELGAEDGAAFGNATAREAFNDVLESGAGSAPVARAGLLGGALLLAALLAS
jgi:hypothetical protein